MTKQEIIKRQATLKRWHATELGSLFEKFVSLHARAWQFDARSGDGYGERSAAKAWKDLEPVEVELRDKLMKIAGIEVGNDNVY